MARTLEELAEAPAVLPIADAARATFPAVDLDEEAAAHVRVGRPLDLALPGAGEHAVFAPDGTFLALYEPTARRRPPGGRLRRLTWSSQPEGGRPHTCGPRPGTGSKVGRGGAAARRHL